MRIATGTSAVLILAAIFGGAQVRAQDSPKGLKGADSIGMAMASSSVSLEKIAIDQNSCSPSNSCSDPTGCCDDVCGPQGRIWVRSEYLLWWTKGDRLPPLVTTSPAGTAEVNAVLGVPGTTVLFGDNQVGDEVRSGGRFTVGTWLNHEQTFGLEGNFFFLANQVDHFDATSNGTPILARPFFEVNNNQQNSVLIAFPDVVRGDVHIATKSNLLGAEANLRANLCCGCCYRLDFVGGYRFLRLSEGLAIDDTEINERPQNGLVGTRFDLADSFDTRNEFHGGQLGLDGEYRRGRLVLGALAKVALGANRREVAINGSTVLSFPEGTRSVFPGALLALPSNIGNFKDTDFAVLPEVGVSLAYQLTDGIRVGCGYTFLYMNHVVRPGQEIDLGVNTTQPPLGNGLVGPARPAFSFQNTDFWAQGINFILELRF